jgi:hypothetical protein
MKKNVKLKKGEVLADVFGLEGVLKVSNFGRVFRVMCTPDCSYRILYEVKIYKNRESGALYYTMSFNGTLHASVLATTVFDAFYPEKRGMRYKFKDGNKRNATLDNIIPSDTPALRRIPRQKLIKEIKSGKSTKEIASKLGCTAQNVNYFKAKNNL